MHHNKDTQNEIIIIEAAVWTFWVFFSGVLKLFSKVSLIMIKPKLLQYSESSNLSVDLNLSDVRAYVLSAEA